LVGAADLDRVFVDDILVGFRGAGVVVDIPAEQPEEGIDELAANLGFVVAARAIGIPVLVEAGDEID
ncbi:MAG: hypothetical protein M3452_11160, partial [Chloroflexota bacterium]|nr:hypothetical protein [Chloroflexota bacterium]